VDAVTRVCQNPDCRRPIENRRPQATTCSEACRKAAHLARKRSARGSRTVSLSVEDGYFEALDARRGYVDDWKPQRKTEIMLGRVEEVLLEYAAQLPLTLRQIYYRMIGRWAYPKGAAFERALYECVDLGRRSGRIPFEHIRDDGILGGGWWYGDVDQWVYSTRRDAEGFTRDVQADQPARLQVWCESAGMVPQLMRVADRYSVPVYSCGGFNSLTAIRQIVDSCVQDTDGPTVVLHLGDCDPSGFSIFQCVFEDVSAFLEEDRRTDRQTFTAERVAVTFDQIDEFSLTTDEIKTGDSRSRSWRARGLTHKVEIEALRPDVIAQLLDDAIKRHLDLHVADAVRDLQARDRAVLAGAVDAAEMAIRPAQKLDDLVRLVRRWHPPREAA
jgi:hypothetical protein